MSIQKLIEAIQKNDLEQIKNLAEQGYDINSKDKDRNPLVFQLFHGTNIYYDTFEALSKLGANFDVKNVKGTTFLSKVIGYGNLDVVSLVLEKSTGQLEMINNSDGKYPLFIAAIDMGNEDMVRLLAEEYKANLNIKSKNGNPLIFGVLDFYSFNYKMAMLLIELGADVNQQNSAGESPLKYAVQARKYDVVEAMLQHGAQPNAKDRAANFIMHFAYETKDEALMSLLVKYGAEIDCKNEEGDTLLAKAIGIRSYRYNQYDYKMVNLLLELGANK